MADFYSIQYRRLRASGWQWREVQRGQIPRCPGTYAVIARGEVIYIGSSLNLADRVMSHWSRRRPVYVAGYSTEQRLAIQKQSAFSGYDTDELTIKIKPSRRIGEWLYRECRLIHRLRPAFNRDGVVRGALENRRAAR